MESRRAIITATIMWGAISAPVGWDTNSIQTRGPAMVRVTIATNRGRDRTAAGTVKVMHLRTTATGDSLWIQ